ncbi:hypothetical protein PgNI_05507 [Pyricularia grisea]|uniref:Uncharacterized protein n=1 Tax=Pyricularia grisea TaxID=148305 RepID=A0A6P8B5F6_PYRGI|nr:hypothetical protein PgNI_05507 [Pyricularia grisea]TLD10490.1 hypothetical protein PgNI_05507 [Pyricularia grisea]
MQPRRRHTSVEAVHDGGRTPGAALATAGAQSGYTKIKEVAKDKSLCFLGLANTHRLRVENYIEVAKDKIPSAASPAEFIRSGPPPASEDPRLTTVTGYHRASYFCRSELSSVAWVVMQPRGRYTSVKTGFTMGDRNNCNTHQDGRLAWFCFHLGILARVSRNRLYHPQKYHYQVHQNRASCYGPLGA